MSSISDPVRFLRTVAGGSLIAAPLIVLVSAIVDASEGTGMTPSELYKVLDASHGRIFVSALLFAAGAVLTVPALGGMLHLTRRRGVLLGHIGADLVLVGAFGHMGYATWQMLLSRVPTGGDQAAMVRYLDRTATVANSVLAPMMIALSLGLILMTIGLRGARAVPAWVPGLVIGLVAFESVLSSSEDPGKWTMVGIWALVLIALGYVGIVVLRMPDAEWAADETAELDPRRAVLTVTPAPPSARPSHLSTSLIEEGEVT